MSTPEDSEFNFQDYADFYNLNDLSIEDEAAVFAAIFEDIETSKGQSDSGQSSSEEHSSIAQAPESAAEEAYCAICMETKTLTEFFETQFCTHLYCYECVRSYVTDKVLDGIGWINCPEPGCEAGFLDPDACHPILPQNVIDRWGDLLCEATIQVKFYCPYKDCSALLMDDNDDDDETSVGDQEIITQSVCPHCHRMFCAQCQSPWHEGIECKEVQELGEGDREREDLMLKEVAESSQWQRCPECKFFVERDEGCNHIVCRFGFSLLFGTKK